MANRRLFVPFTKIDEETREVAGRLTQEIVDRDGEIWDYESSIPHMKAWSDGFAEATGGKSLGNLRAMHQPISAGKVTAIDFNEVDKAVDIVVKVIDDKEWEKTREGVYTGFSIGGKVVRSWRDANEPKYKRFEIRPIEASLADLPCVPTATFDYVKVGGIVETRHFNKIKQESLVKPTKFADAANRKFPIETKAQTRVSMAAWGKTAAKEKYSPEDQAKIVTELVTAATAHGIEGVTEKTISSGDYSKGLYDVSRLADSISTLGWLAESARYEREYEGDDSTVPDELTGAIATLLSTLETMVGEEGDELLRMLGLETAAKTETTKAATPAATSPEAPAIVPPVAAEPAQPVETPVVAPVADAVIEPVAEKVTGADFTKAMAKKHAAALADLADQAKAVHKIFGDHVEKMAAFCKDMTPSDDDTDDGSTKIASAEFEKITGQLADWQKRAEAAESELTETRTKLAATQAQAEELAALGEKLTAALEVRKGSLIAVDRNTDGQSATSLKAATPPPAPRTDLAPGEVDRDAFQTSMKTAFANPLGPSLRQHKMVAKT